MSYLKYICILLYIFCFSTTLLANTIYSFNSENAALTVKADVDTSCSLNVFFRKQDGENLFPISIDDILFRGKYMFEVSPVNIGDNSFVRILAFDISSRKREMYLFKLPTEYLGMTYIGDSKGTFSFLWTDGSPQDYSPFKVAQICVEITPEKKYYYKEIPSFGQKFDYMFFSNDTIVKNMIDGKLKVKLSQRDSNVALGLLLKVENEKDFLVGMPLRTFFNYTANSVMVEGREKDTFFCLWGSPQKIMLKKIVTLSYLYKFNGHFFVKQKSRMSLMRIPLNGKVIKKSPVPLSYSYGEFFTFSAEGDFFGSNSLFFEYNKN